MNCLLLCIVCYSAFAAQNVDRWSTVTIGALSVISGACPAVVADVHSSVDFVWPDMYAVPDPFLSEFQLGASIAEVSCCSCMGVLES